jgi:hypothetical protein
VVAWRLCAILATAISPPCHGREMACVDAPLQALFYVSTTSGR